MTMAERVSEGDFAAPAFLASQGQPVMDTSEVRWFAIGSIPHDVVAWFSEQDTITTFEERYDTYLLHGLDGLGAKYRDRRVLEVKWRQDVGPNLTLGPGLSTPVMRWLKWRPFQLDAALSAPDVGHLDVHKVVLTSSFAPINGSVVPHALPDDASIPACKIELAAIEVEGVAAWTLGLEASGPIEARLRVLLDSWRSISVDALPSYNGFAGSFHIATSYPDWLERHLPDWLAG